MFLIYTWNVRVHSQIRHCWVATPYRNRFYMSEQGNWQRSVSTCFRQERRANRNWKWDEG